MNVLDRVIGWVAPQWAQNRARARLLARHFEAAAIGRRAVGRTRLLTDANTAAPGPTLAFLRAQARDLVRNNPWARKGLRRIVSNTVGWGIRPKALGRTAAVLMDRWKRWAETTDCDATGRLNFYGLQRLVMRTVVESGECLVRRRMRRPIDGLAVPMQLQLLEPDYLDSSRDGYLGIAGGPIVQGVEFDAIGRRAAYWLFDQHPGGRLPVNSPVSKRIPADSILHVYDQERPGQVRGPSWFASIDVRLHDFDEFEDATLMKQKIAACLAAFVTDLDGAGTALGAPGTDISGQQTDTFEPGMIIPLPPGKQVTVANPPQASDHQSFSASSLRGVAAGLGVSYEDLCGDYSQVTYSSARMSRLAAQGDIDEWRWQMLIPQLCAPVWDWMEHALLLEGVDVEEVPAEWTPPPMTILEPDTEGTAYQRLLRIGAMTWPQMVRALGYDPADQIKEIDQMNKTLDKLGIVLDSDPRRMTSAGQQQQAPTAPGGPAAAGAGAESGSPDAADGDTTDDTTDGEPNGAAGAPH